MNGKNDRWFVGCACDRKYVQHTAVMLTSLAINGNVPEATILIAAFDLEADDYDVLRAHAGALSHQIRFVEVTPSMLQDVMKQNWEAHYPPSVIGRLFLPRSIAENGARLLTLDSDMIVNVSVRPLFELDLLGDYIGAIHDTPRDDDLNYFNSGMMIIDVDQYRHYDVAARSLRWLAAQEQQPRWPDQDALNTVVGHKWYRLDRRWNWAFCGERWGDRPGDASQYDNAFIAHFTGQGKPWNSPSHAGRLLYEHYRKEYELRALHYSEAREHVDANFVATAMEVLLGRGPASLEELDSFYAPTAHKVLKRITATDEFAANVHLPVKLDVPFGAGMHQIPLTLRQRLWAAERLPLCNHAATRARASGSSAELLKTILTDPIFCGAMHL